MRQNNDSAEAFMTAMTKIAAGNKNMRLKAFIAQQMWKCRRIFNIPS